MNYFHPVPYTTLQKYSHRLNEFHIFSHEQFYLTEQHKVEKIWLKENNTWLSNIFTSENLENWSAFVFSLFYKIQP